MAKEIEINLEEENNVSMEVKDTGNVEIGMESDFGGTTDYNKLKNKPSINGVTLEGNKTLEELGIINYDDTEIKENITEIEKENTYQNKRLEYLEKNQIQGEVKGEDTLTITDGAFAYANILKETEIEVEGKKKKAYIVGLPQGLSRQEQREGYNQFNSEIETQTIKGVEVSYDKVTGYIKLNGIVETDVEGEKYDSNIFNLKNGGKISIKGNTNYTLSISKISGSYSTILQLEASSLIQLWENSSGSWLYPYQLSFYNLKTSSSVNITKSQTTDVIYNQIQLTLRDGDVFDNLIIGIQFNEGELKPFEQYGATPSIEIPSEIENVRAYNLFDKDTVINNKYIDATGNENINDQWVITDYMEVDSNSNYTYFGITVSGVAPYSAFYDSNKTFISSFKQKTKKNIIEVPENAKYVRFSIYYGSNGNDLNTFIFYKGKEYKPYAPYGAISIGLGNKNLFDKNNYISLNSYFNNTETPNISSLVTTKSIFLECKENTEYTISRKTGKRFYVGYINDYPANGILVNNVLGTDTKEVNEYTLTTGSGAKYLAIYLYNSQYDTNITFEEMISSLQVEEHNSKTSYVEHQEQNYNLHLGDLELNGIANVRDSLLVELDDYFAVTKTVKKLYHKKFYDKINNFTGLIKDFTSSGSNERASLTIDSNFKFSHLYENPGLSNILKTVNNGATYSNVEGFTVNVSDTYSTLYMYIDEYKDLTAEEYIAKLNEIGAYFILPLKEPELIDLTKTYPELVQDIENIINNMFTYEEVTHIDTPIGYLELTYTKSNKLIIKNYDDRISALEQAILLIGGQNV